jgi:hypothetical protein
MKGYVTCHVCEEEDTCDEGVRDVSCVCRIYMYTYIEHIYMHIYIHI